MDQLIAQKIGQDNKLPSLELGLESLAMVGDCESANCGYLTTLAYSTPTTPLPAETNPREVFERLFGDAGEHDAGGAAGADQVEPQPARLGHERHVAICSAASATATRPRSTSTSTRCARWSAASRRRRARTTTLPPTMEAPTGAPAVYGDHAKLMFDLQALAFQSDSTRVIDDDDGTRDQQPPVPGDRPERAAPLDDAQPGCGGASREHHDDQHLPGVAARVLPGEAGEDAGWRRLAARSLDHPLRFGAERRQHPPAARTCRSSLPAAARAR